MPFVIALREHIFLHDCFASPFRIYLFMFCPFERDANFPTLLACIRLKSYSYVAIYYIFQLKVVLDIFHSCLIVNAF